MSWNGHCCLTRVKLRALKCAFLGVTLVWCRPRRERSGGSDDRQECDRASDKQGDVNGGVSDNRTS